jgi:hypothetical protein
MGIGEMLLQGLGIETRGSAAWDRPGAWVALTASQALRKFPPSAWEPSRPLLKLLLALTGISWVEAQGNAT